MRESAVQQVVVRIVVAFALSLALAVAFSTTAGADQALAKGKWYSTKFYYANRTAPKDTITKKYVTVRGKMHKMKRHASNACKDKIYRTTLSGKKHRYKITSKTKFYLCECNFGRRWRVSKSEFLRQFKSYRSEELKYKWHALEDVCVKVYKGKALAVEALYAFE